MPSSAAFASGRGARAHDRSAHMFRRLPSAFCCFVVVKLLEIFARVKASGRETSLEATNSMRVPRLIG